MQVRKVFPQWKPILGLQQMGWGVLLVCTVWVHQVWERILFPAVVSTMETNTWFTTKGMRVGFLNGSMRGLEIF